MPFYSSKLKTGGTIEITTERILCQFPVPRTGISTSPSNGGIQIYDGIFIQRLMQYIDHENELPGGSLGSYLSLVAQQERLNCGTGLITTAKMENFGHSIATGLDTIEVYATAGVKGNAARAGEPPLYQEIENGFNPVGGTINLLVFLSVSLPLGILARALITLTEAKSAILSEMGISSVTSGQAATGTSTDGIILVMNDSGPLRTDVGTYSELGSLMATAAQQAIKQSVIKE